MQLTSIRTDIQRKGLYIGQRQLFLDFALSNIDTVKTAQGAGTPPKDYAPEELLLAVKEELKHKPQLIVLGGGEPLLQIAELLPVLKEVPWPIPAGGGVPLCLETNATMPDRLAEIKPYVSLYALEYVADYQREFFDSLLLVKDAKVYVRAPVDKHTAPADIDRLAKMLGAVRKDLPLVLEPVFGSKNYLSLQALALRHLQSVRVIPPMHI
ncbi:MAG: radical SAM protein [Candidatus Margulisbacteria bacterium]|jgi:organic radical activating enzyme|nr:radical SAM protein [Candidatus Margulisiibacteriota bacterium]